MSNVFLLPRAKIALAAGIAFTLVCVVLTIIAIVRDRATIRDAEHEPLLLCLVDYAPSGHMRHAVNKLERRWKGTVKLEIKRDGIACDAELRFSTEMSPLSGEDYAPGMAIRECESCVPYALIYKDGWEGGIAGAGQFVLDHEVGHLLCLTHWPAGSVSVMRPSVWGGGDSPKPSMITPDVLAAARINRAVGCVGPVAENVR